MATESDSVRLLVQHDRLEEAAALAEARGRFDQARELWERACRFDDAARAALRAGDPARAIVLAARAGDEPVEAAARAALVADPARARAAASALAQAGQHATGARLLLAIGEVDAAGAAFERARLPRAAGAAFERAERWQAALSAYRSALAADPDDAAARLRLGRLLLGAGDEAAAIRVLQRIPERAPERAPAMSALHAAFQRLGMVHAAAHVAPAADATAEEPAPIRNGELLFGRYQLVRHVATTGAARLFEAVDRLDGTRVAIKVLRVSGLTGKGRDAAARFEREACALEALRHPHIVPLSAFLREVPALILRWMPGGSLADKLAAEALSPARGAEIALALCSALAEAHRRGILHRDVKPSNVLFDERARPRLGDFGAAHAGDLAETMTAGMFGTLGYMAPEVRRAGPATPASDVYGVGAVLWHVLTGGPPSLALPWLASELGPDEQRVAELLIADVARRPQNAGEAAALIGSVEWSRTTPPLRPTSVQPPTAPAARLSAGAGARHHDRWLERELYVVPATEANLSRARALAELAHPALPAVFAYLEREATLWIEAPPRNAARAEPLGPADLATLEQAVSLLHARAVAHGAIDLAHVYRDAGVLRLAFPLEPRHASAERDLADLERLAGAPPSRCLP